MLLDDKYKKEYQNLTGEDIDNSYKDEQQLLLELFELTSQWIDTYSQLRKSIGDKPLALLKEMISDKIKEE